MLTGLFKGSEEGSLCFEQVNFFELNYFFVIVFMN